MNVLSLDRGRDWQGDSVSRTPFDPVECADYTDFRGNPYVKPGSPHENQRFLLLGKE